MNQYMMIFGLMYFNSVALGADVGAVRVERCSAVWKVTLEVAAQKFSTILCQGVSDASLDFEQIQHSLDLESKLLFGSQHWQDNRLQLEISESEAGTTIWSAWLDPKNLEWQSLQREGAGSAARARISAQPIPLGGYVQIDARQSTAAEILKALLATSTLKVSAKVSLAQRFGTKISAIPALSILRLIGDVGNAAVISKGHQAYELRAIRDAAKVAALVEAIAKSEQAESAGGAAEIAQTDALYQQLRALTKIRGPQDVPDSPFALHRLATRLQRDEKYSELVDLRRDMLAVAKLYADEELLLVAQARADLAFALQLAAVPGNEDLVLLKLAEPVLLAKRDELEISTVSDQAAALRQRGLGKTAIALLNASFVPCWEDNQWQWLIDQEGISWQMLQLFRDTGSTEQAEQVLVQWRRCMKYQGSWIPSHRIVQASYRVRAGEFAAAAADFDLIFLRLPPLAELDSTQLEFVFTDALKAHLASGNYARAAEILQLSQLAQAARNPPNAQQLAKNQREQNFLSALAVAKPQAPSFWDQRYRSEEPLAPAQATPKVSTSDFSDGELQFAASVIVSLTSLPGKLSDDAALSINEAAAVLSFIAVQEGFGRSSPDRYIAAAMKLRAQAGESPETLSAHKAELQKLTALAEKLAREF